MFNYLTTKTGNEIKNYHSVGNIFNNLAVTIANKLKPPEWVTQEVFEKMKELRKKVSLLKFSTKKLQRLRTGVFFNDLLTKIEKIAKISNSESLKDEFAKLNIYSTVS